MSEAHTTEHLESASLDADFALSTHGRIARVLGMEILSGKLKPGQVLPAEAVLLTRFGISRTVLREVIKTLTAKGFVVSKTRVGTKVQPPECWSFFDSDVLSWKLALGYDADFRDDLAEIRRAVEPRAAALAATRRTSEHIAELRGWIAKMREPGHSAKSFAEADLGLHLAIGTASGNLLMRSIGSIIEAALTASFKLNSAVSEQAVLQASIADHEAIVDAIAAGEADVAAQAMLRVIELGTARIKASKAMRP